MQDAYLKEPLISVGIPLQIMQQLHEARVNTIEDFLTTPDEVIIPRIGVEWKDTIVSKISDKFVNLKQGDTVKKLSAKAEGAKKYWADVKAGRRIRGAYVKSGKYAKAKRAPVPQTVTAELEQIAERHVKRLAGKNIRAESMTVTFSVGDKKVQVTGKDLDIAFI